MPASLIKQGVSGRSFSHISCQLCTLSCNLRYKSYFQLRIRSKWPRSTTRNRVLYYLHPSTQMCICKTVIIDCTPNPLYPQTWIGRGSFLKGVARYSDSLRAHFVSIRAKAFALMLASIEEKTWNLLRNIVHRIEQLFPPTSWPKSILDMSTLLLDLKAESLLRVPLFLSPLSPLSPLGPKSALRLPSLLFRTGSPLRSGHSACKRNRLPSC